MVATVVAAILSVGMFIALVVTSVLLAYKFQAKVCGLGAGCFIPVQSKLCIANVEWLAIIFQLNQNVC